MKKWICVFLAGLMMLGASGALAQSDETFSFADVADLDFYFSSGVGAWFTLLRIDENGAFTGEFHDSEMGDADEAYPNGTVYGCLFHGQLSVLEKENDFSWKLRLDSLELDDGQVDEWIEDGIRYVTSAPYGLENTEELILYLPGTPVADLPEGFLPWSHLDAFGENLAALPYYALYNAAEECGFIGEERLVPQEEAAE